MFPPCKPAQSRLGEFLAQMCSVHVLLLEPHAQTPPLYAHRTPPAQQSMCRSDTLFLLWTSGILHFVGFCAVCFPLDANPRVGKLRMLAFCARGGADELGFVCFVVHWAPFSYTDCLNTLARCSGSQLSFCSRGKKVENYWGFVFFLICFFRAAIPSSISAMVC